MIVNYRLTPYHSILRFQFHLNAHVSHPNHEISCHQWWLASSKTMKWKICTSLFRFQRNFPNTSVTLQLISNCNVCISLFSPFFYLGLGKHLLDGGGLLLYMYVACMLFRDVCLPVVVDNTLSLRWHCDAGMHLMLIEDIGKKRRRCMNIYKIDGFRMQPTYGKHKVQRK